MEKKELTLKQFQTIKHDLENQICVLLNEFQDNTGCGVYRLDIGDTIAIGFNKFPPVITNVLIEVHI